MSAEDRNVRLCDCGKPAGHESLCVRNREDPDGIRVDLATEERMSREREEHFRGRRSRFDADRRERRGRMSTLALLGEAMRHAARLSTVTASSPEPSRGGGEQVGPPRQQSITADPRWEDAARIIRKRVLDLLDLVDEAEGTGHAQIAAELSSEEKDRIILEEGRGLIAERWVAERGESYGSASYVRKLRRRMGMDTRGRLRLES